MIRECFIRYFGMNVFHAIALCHTILNKLFNFFFYFILAQGDLIHDGTNNDNKFPQDGIAYKRFVFDLPQKNACDMLHWCWTQRLEENGKLELLCTFNISSLMNSSYNKANIAPQSSTSQKFYAIRDINKGEEILYDYDIYETDWEDVGL